MSELDLSVGSAASAARIASLAPPEIGHGPGDAASSAPPTGQGWAPAWFYSALGWLDKTYVDASNVTQQFENYLCGSDVDPYAKLGATRLFMVLGAPTGYRLSIAANPNSVALAGNAVAYPATDDGIGAMYAALAASSVFADIRYCYVPCRSSGRGQGAAAIESGYDPDSGLRAVALGSAVAQVVPVADFLKAGNRPVFDPYPTIVPIVSALVYDITHYNALGAKTFTLPTLYTRDRIGSADYVSRVNRSVIFAGGPGYDDTSATALFLQSSSSATGPDHTLTTYVFATCTVTTIGTIGDRVQSGISELTCNLDPPSRAFTSQRLVGFYQISSWQTCLGAPIWDFGGANAAFTATPAPAPAVTLIYDPAAGTLNGGSLAGAVQKLQAAQYLEPVDSLVARIGASVQSAKGRLVTTAATLDFAVDPRTGATSFLDRFDVPVKVSVTSTPPPVPGAVGGTSTRARAPAGGSAQSIGGSGNIPSKPPPGPTTIQADLTAWMPREALEGTGIGGIEAGVAFAGQSLGDGSAFASQGGSTLLNLMERSDVAAAWPPVDLPISGLKASFGAGITYVLALNGKVLSIRGSDGSATDMTLSLKATDPQHTYVGALCGAELAGTVRLYAKLSLTIPAPAVGANGVATGQTYQVSLVYGDKTCVYDVTDVQNAAVVRGASTPSPKPADRSTPHSGDLYFGSFSGGDATVTVWNVPIFLPVRSADISSARFAGAMTLAALTEGAAELRLAIADTSLFVYSDLNIDTGQTGSASPSGAFIASAVINFAPDDRSPRAFAPSPALMGLVRPVQIGSQTSYVFTPADDSVVIAGQRYATSGIPVRNLDFDPSARPYPPSAWPESRFWQFANKHNPYRGVRYTGRSQSDRLTRAEGDIVAIAKTVQAAHEPMQLYLDTGIEGMTIWPIYGFPLEPNGQAVDTTQLQGMTAAVLELLANLPPAVIRRAPGADNPEGVVLPAELTQPNPFAASAETAPSPSAAPIAAPRPFGVLGKSVINLNPATVNAGSAPQVATGAADPSAGEIAAALSRQQALSPGVKVIQAATELSKLPPRRPPPVRQRPIYGFSVASARGEAYLVELVDSDQSVFDRLPDPTQNLTYDPYYVRVVDLRTLTSYNMSIIVPAIAHDQYGYFARQREPYANLLARTDELSLGYFFRIADVARRYDELTFDFEPITARDTPLSESLVYTNVPYAVPQATDSFALRLPPPTAFFACRRENWNADCHLMRATHQQGSAAYMAFGGGDLVPMKLDTPPVVDKRAPAHLYKLTYTVANQPYAAAKTISVGNTPYVVAVTDPPSRAPQYMAFSLDAAPGGTDISTTPSAPLQFPTEIYVAGQLSTSLTSITSINAVLGTTYQTTGEFFDDAGSANFSPAFELVPYNNLVYLIRAVTNLSALGAVGGLGQRSGFLVDTFVPTASGNLALAQGARHRRSGMSFFGASYTPTTQADSLDNLDFTSITGDVFYTPTLFIPVAELDGAKGFAAAISDFVGQQFWTFIYPEVVAQAGSVANGVTWPNGLNIDADANPILSLQKLHFVYDPQVILFTPNDLSHKYALQPKQQVLALTNDQIREGICWRSANLQPQRLAPATVCAQQILPQDDDQDRPNIIYSAQNRGVLTATRSGYKGMSLANLISVSATIYNIEETAFSTDQTASGLVSAVSSNANMVIGVLFDYDNDDQGSLTQYDADKSNKGVVLLNGYLSAGGFNFSSPDHFDVNDVLRSQLPLLDQVANTLGYDVAYYNTDASLPRQFWGMTYDSFTASGAPNFITDLPPAPVDPTFGNRTRSLLLNLENALHPTALGLMDTYNSVVSANLHLMNGVTGSIFLNKKADRDIASIGSNPTSGGAPLAGLPTKYDFFIVSRDHYLTLKGATFELIDHGYAMCLVDDGSGSGTKIAKYFTDAAGNYNELISYALYSPNGGIIETQTFAVKVALGQPGNANASPPAPQTPNGVNPQDIVVQINKLSNLIYAVAGPSSPGQPAAIIPIQTVGGAVQAAPLVGPPGPSGYALNVLVANRQPVQISQIFSGLTAYPIAGATTIQPINIKTGKPIPFYGSVAHGLDKMSLATLTSADLQSSIPRATTPAGPAAGQFGGNGLGALIGTPFSAAFQGSGAIPPAVAANPSPGTIMKADDGMFYTYNAVTNTMMDSTGKSVLLSTGQYFVDATDPANPIYGVVSLPKFQFNGNTYTVNLSTTAAGVSRYTLVVAGRSYLFGPDNAHVTVDGTTFAVSAQPGGVFTVTYAAKDAPAGAQAPSPISVTPFSIAMGGATASVDVFGDPAKLKAIVLGVTGRTYAYDPVLGQVTIQAGPASTVATLHTSVVYPSASGYGYVVGYTQSAYTVNGAPMFPYAAALTGPSASWALTTAPQMFTVGGDFYSFDRDPSGGYLSVTGNQGVYPVNSYQVSINGAVYILNTSVQPNTVVGGGNSYLMSAANTHFKIDGAQYTISLKAGSLAGATIAGQFNIVQGDAITIENYVYQLDTLNGQLVGNGQAYPLTNSGLTYTITTQDRSFTVTSEPNAATVSIGGVVYEINNATVVGDGIVYPILPYRTFADGADAYTINPDGTITLPTPFKLTGAAPFTRATFTDGPTYTVNDLGAFDGTTYYRLSGSPLQFKAAKTYTLRTDAVAITAGAQKTYLGPTSGAPSPTQFTFGAETIFFGRPGDLAAFDGQTYFAIANNSFTDAGKVFTISGNTAVHDGDSYEIFSNLGQGPYFQAPGGSVYYLNLLVANTGSASGDVYNVFPIASGQFTIPLRYTLAISAGGVTIDSSTFGAATAAPGLSVSGVLLTGGTFTDPVTGITYTCTVDNGAASFIDLAGTVYPYPAPGQPKTFVAQVPVTVGVSVAVDDQPTPNRYPVVNNQFVDGAATFAVNLPIAYANVAGPFLPMVNGRFVVPQAAPKSDVTYTVRGGNVVKGWMTSADDQFSRDGVLVYMVNDVNVARASGSPALAGAAPNQTLTDGARTYSLDSGKQLASAPIPGVVYDPPAKAFTASVQGVPATYSVTAAGAADSRTPPNAFPVTANGADLSFTDTVANIAYSFDSSGANPIYAAFPLVNGFFTDAIAGATYYVDDTANLAVALSYLPITRRAAFTAADGNLYLIHYNQVRVNLPVTSGAQVNAGVATVGANTFTVEIDAVDPALGASTIPINLNSFELNGNLYTIAGQPNGSDYTACQVIGDGAPPRPFVSPNSFRLGDSAVTYRLRLDASNLPVGIEANFDVKPSQDLLAINDHVYIISYHTSTGGALQGQGQAAIPIVNSGFVLTNSFDSTTAKFIFTDLNIYDASSVVGQFTVYLAPTFSMRNRTYTLDPVKLSVTDGDRRPYPLIANPTMFSLNGFNYVIDTNAVPHAIVGNGGAISLATDVTVEAGQPRPNTTFALNGQVYEYTRDTAGTLLAITGAKSYPIAQPAQTFKLDSSLIFTLAIAPPAAGSFAGAVAPIGTVTAGTTALNVYKGVAESGGADFFTYKNVLYTLVKSTAGYVAVQKSYSVYAAQPEAGQQQLATFNMGGTTYLVTDGTTAGDAAPGGINHGSLWAATAISPAETQFGLVYGFAQPTTVTRSAQGVFQFQAADPTGVQTAYDIVYAASGAQNVVKVDVPALLPTFTQGAPFSFTASYPLTFETGGYNAFTTFVDETSAPALSYAAAYKTPVTSSDPQLDGLIGKGGDFSVEFWHSIPAITPAPLLPFSFHASATSALVFNAAVEFADATTIYVRVNNSVMKAKATPPVFSSGWRHVALTYQQPYTLLCQGAGFEVKAGDNYNFNREFSIAMTFSASDVQSEQGLLYKGTGSDKTPPELAMSYRVGLQGGNVTFEFTDGDNKVQTFEGPTVAPNVFYQLIIVKSTTSPLSPTDGTDPYAPPFDPSDLGTLTSGGMSGQGSSSGGAIAVSSVQPAGAGAQTNTAKFLTKISSPASSGYEVTISVRVINDDGSFGAAGWQSAPTPITAASQAGLSVASTGTAHLLIGAAFDDAGKSFPFGALGVSKGNIRDVYLFANAIDRTGVRKDDGTTVDIAQASAADLLKAGLVGYWAAAYDPNGVINSPYDSDAVAVSTNPQCALLIPLAGYEREGMSLYVNGYPMTLSLVTGPQVPTLLTGSPVGYPELTFNAGAYRLAECSIWREVRQDYQVIDDMFGRLIPSNEPTLITYLSGSFEVQNITAPILPMAKYIDNITIANAAPLALTFAAASLDLAGCPAVGRCGPLITPNLYTPPGVALTVCDTVPDLTTYSVTLNTLSAGLAGEVNEAYVYLKNKVLTLYAGKKVGDLVLSWVSQEQGDAQLIGYIEGAPPAPMANLTNKASYAGATSLSFSAPTSATFKLQRGYDKSTDSKTDISGAVGVGFALGNTVAPFGLGLHGEKSVAALTLNLGVTGSSTGTTGNGDQLTVSNKLDESNKYTIKLQGTLSPVTADPFMASLNSATIASATVGATLSKTAILPNPNLGGFTSSAVAAALPKVPNDEKFGMRMYQPSPYGQAYVVSQTLDVYQQTLLQTNTVYGFIRLPDPQIPRDFNILSFRINSQYLRPGVLDGVIGYAYNPATLPTGAQSYATSTGEMAPLYDKNFDKALAGHDAAYTRVVEAYKLKRQIDQQAYDALALYQAQSRDQSWTELGVPTFDTAFTPGLDFYDEYIWTSRGGTQEVKHTYTTTFDEVYNLTKGSTDAIGDTFELKIAAGGLSILDIKQAYTKTTKDTFKTSYNSTGISSFDITASFDGLETDTQMRYQANNDAHFVMKNNSTFNSNNQSGLNLVIGSDGLVYNVAPSVASGAGQPTDNNLDDSQTYIQPQPAYASGNASGITGALEPYDRPGKVKQFRTYTFFLQPREENADVFWNTVVDPTWLANSPDPDAAAMRDAQKNLSIPWRLLYRVTDCERFLPPVTTDAVAVPQITPVMAVPVVDPAANFLFTALGAAPRPAENPGNDIEANVVLAAPTASGASAGTPAQAGPNIGQPVLPNNVIPFDLIKPTTPIVNWGDTANAKLLGALATSVLGTNTVPMATRAAPGSTKLYDVLDPVGGGPLYSVFTDPNGLTVNVAAKAGLVVYQDVNGNPVQYFDGKTFHSLQADYVASPDGTVMYYLEPPSTYDQSSYSLTGDYDLYGHPGDLWRYFLVSGMSADMTSDPAVSGNGPFLASSGAYVGLRPAGLDLAGGAPPPPKGYVLIKGALTYPHLNIDAEVSADVQVYKSLSVLDTFPIGDATLLTDQIKQRYSTANFIENDDICTVLSRNIISYFNTLQATLIPQ